MNQRCKSTFIKGVQGGGGGTAFGGDTLTQNGRFFRRKRGQLGGTVQRGQRKLTGLFGRQTLLDTGFDQGFDEQKHVGWTATGNGCDGVNGGVLPQVEGTRMQLEDANTIALEMPRSMDLNNVFQALTGAGM